MIPRRFLELIYELLLRHNLHDAYRQFFDSPLHIVTLRYKFNIRFVTENYRVSQQLHGRWRVVRVELLQKLLPLFLFFLKIVLLRLYVLCLLKVTDLLLSFTGDYSKYFPKVAQARQLFVFNDTPVSLSLHHQLRLPSLKYGSIRYPYLTAEHPFTHRQHMLQQP